MSPLLHLTKEDISKSLEEAVDEKKTQIHHSVDIPRIKNLQIALRFLKIQQRYSNQNKKEKWEFYTILLPLCHTS